MRMDEMNKELENRGFTVTRSWVPGRKGYLFVIKRDGHELSREFSYPVHDFRPYEIQEKFIEDLSSDFELMYPSHLDVESLYPHTMLRSDIIRYCKMDVDITNQIYSRFHPFAIDKVIFNDPATIVMWKDGTKTVVKCNEGDTYDPEKGLAMAISKKALGNKGNYYNTFTEWLPEEEEFNAEEFWDNLKNILFDKISSYPIPPLQIRISKEEPHNCKNCKYKGPPLTDECVDCHNHSNWEPARKEESDNG